MNSTTSAHAAVAGGSACSEGGTARSEGLCEKIEARVFSPLSRKAPRRSIEMEVKYRLKLLGRSPATSGLLKETESACSGEEALDCIEHFLERNRA